MPRQPQDALQVIYRMPWQVRPAIVARRFEKPLRLAVDRFGVQWLHQVHWFALLIREPPGAVSVMVRKGHAAGTLSGPSEAGALEARAY